MGAELMGGVAVGWEKLFLNLFCEGFGVCLCLHRPHDLFVFVAKKTNPPRAPAGGSPRESSQRRGRSFLN